MSDASPLAYNACSWVEIIHTDRISVHNYELRVDDCRIELHSWLLSSFRNNANLPLREFSWTNDFGRKTVCAYRVYFGLTTLDAITVVLLGVAKPARNPYE